MLRWLVSNYLYVIFLYIYIHSYDIYSKKKVYLRENGVEFLPKNLMFPMYRYEFCTNKLVSISFLPDPIWRISHGLKDKLIWETCELTVLCFGLWLIVWLLSLPPEREMVLTCHSSRWLLPCSFHLGDELIGTR